HPVGAVTSLSVPLPSRVSGEAAKGETRLLLSPLLLKERGRGEGLFPLPQPPIPIPPPGSPLNSSPLHLALPDSGKKISSFFLTSFCGSPSQKGRSLRRYLCLER